MLPKKKKSVLTLCSFSHILRGLNLHVPTGEGNKSYSNKLTFSSWLGGGGVLSSRECILQGLGAPRPSGFRPAKAPKGTRKSTKEEAEHGSAAALSLVSPETPPGGEAGGKPGGQRFSPAAPGRGSPVSRPPPPRDAQRGVHCEPLSRRRHLRAARGKAVAAARGGAGRVQRR